MKKNSYTIIFFISLFFCFSLLLFPGYAVSEMKSNNKIQAGTPPFEVVKRILATNDMEVSHPPVFQDKYAPLITWLTDPDVRIQPQLIIVSPINKLYTIRNMGAQLEKAAAAVEYGIRNLHTPILLITLDSDNKAFRVLMEKNNEHAPALHKKLNHIKLSKVTTEKKKSFQEHLIENIEANIDYQVYLAVSSYKDRIESGRLAVIGSIADFANIYKRGSGRLIIINVNGETDSKKLKGLPIMTSISPELRERAIGRERGMMEAKDKLGSKEKKAN